MTIFSESGFRKSRLPLLNTQAFALEQLVSIHSVTLDLRWAMVELAWRSFTGRFVMWTRHRTPREQAGPDRPCCC
jgi:hypothetical protein